MRLSHRCAVALTLAISVLTQVVLAANAATSSSANQSPHGQDRIDAQANLLVQEISTFKSTCLDASGNFVDKEISDGSGVIYSCANEYAVLSTQVPALLNQQRKLDASSGKHCEVSQNDLLGDNGPLASGVASIANKVPACGQSQDSSCTTDITCNLMRSLSDPGGFLLQLMPRITNKIQSEMPKQLASCLGPAQPGCVSTFVTGVFEDLWSNVEGLWTGISYVAQKGWQSMEHAGDYFGSLLGISAAQKAESDMEAKALAASTQSPSMIDQFKSDPLAFIKKMFTDLVSAVENAVISNFACAKYDGLKCTEPADSWTCATCDERMNAICGTIGFIGGEIVTTYLTAGAATIATKTMEAVKTGVDALEISQRVTKALPRLEDLKNSIQKTTDAIKLSVQAGKVGMASRVADAAAAFAEHPAVAKLAEAASGLSDLATTAGKVAVTAGKRLVASSDVLAALAKGTQVVVHVAGNVAKSFLNFMDSVVKLGIEHGTAASDALLPNALKVRRAEYLEQLAARLDSTTANLSKTDAARVRKQASKLVAEANRLKAQLPEASKLAAASPKSKPVEEFSLQSIGARLTTKAAGAVLSADDPPVYLDVNGKSIILKPDSYSGGYYGTDVDPETVVHNKGFHGANAPDMDLRHHVERHGIDAGNDGLMGVTPTISEPTAQSGGAYWGQWVYEIRGEPTYDVNHQLEGRISKETGGFRGNLTAGENELAIPRNIPIQKIRRWGRVEEDPFGRPKVVQWINNPAYVGN